MVIAFYFGVLVGFLLFNFFTHLQIALRSHFPRRESTLLLATLAILLYSILSYVEYRIFDISVYFVLIRVQLICEPLFLISILEFFLALSGEKRNRAFLVFEILFSVSAFVRYFLPNTGSHIGEVRLTAYVLPWGESINLIQGTPTIYYIPYLAFVLAAVGLGTFVLRRLYAKGSRREAILLFAGLALLLCGVLVDIAIAAGYIRWFYLTEGCYAIMTLVAGFEVTDEVVKFSEIKKELELSVEEKNVLIKEIHHRVKNNLQVIASLLSLQASDCSSSEAKLALVKSTDRVRAIALVHEQLYSADGRADIDFAEYTDRLVKGIVKSLGDVASRIDFASEVGSLRLGLGLGIPLGIILNELIVNSIKYGKVPGKLLQIRLLARRINGRIAFEYSDDGPGFPPAFDADRGGGLGLTLIRTLAEQIFAEGGFVARGCGVLYRIEFEPDKLGRV